MKTYDEILKENGWKSGIWNNPFSKVYALEPKSKKRKAVKDKNKK